MPVAKKHKHVGIKWVTHDQALALLDARARRVLNMSGKEFVAKWKAGEFKKMDSGDCPGVIGVALLASASERPRGRKKPKRSNR
jgi:hypothetical protein